MWKLWGGVHITSRSTNMTKGTGRINQVRRGKSRRSPFQRKRRRRRRRKNHLRHLPLFFLLHLTWLTPGCRVRSSSSSRSSGKAHSINISGFISNFFHLTDFFSSFFFLFSSSSSLPVCCTPPSIFLSLFISSQLNLLFFPIKGLIHPTQRKFSSLFPEISILTPSQFTQIYFLEKWPDTHSINASLFFLFHWHTQRELGNCRPFLCSLTPWYLGGLFSMRSISIFESFLRWQNSRTNTDIIFLCYPCLFLLLMYLSCCWRTLDKKWYVVNGLSTN